MRLFDASLNSSKIQPTNGAVPVKYFNYDARFSKNLFKIRTT